MTKSNIQEQNEFRSKFLETTMKLMNGNDLSDDEIIFTKLAKIEFDPFF